MVDNNATNKDINIFFKELKNFEIINNDRINGIPKAVETKIPDLIISKKKNVG